MPSFPLLDSPQGYRFAFIDTIVGSNVLVGWMTGTTMVNSMYVFIALSCFNSETKPQLIGSTSSILRTTAVLTTNFIGLHCLKYLIFYNTYLDVS